ncbi:nitrate reductase molybdenum cofactor assembly chaperone [Mycobacterium sp. NPDC003449]
MKRRGRACDTLQDRAVWQAASLLLTYPDEGHSRRLATVDGLLAHVTGPPAGLIAETLAALGDREVMALAVEYVETFDLDKRATMLLTYWTGGDTRNRGAQMVAFTQAYRAAGVAPPEHEAPDHLPVVLEFAATVDPDGGRRLLCDHRLPIEVLRHVLTESGSPYAAAVAAVCATLPDVADGNAQRLLRSGPPAESVGLQPFALTVPPRRVQGGV